MRAGFVEMADASSARALYARERRAGLKMINRSLVVVKVRQPFVDWLRGLPDPEPADVTVARVNEDSHVYLLPEWDTLDEAEVIL